MEYKFRILSCLGLYRNRKKDEIPFMQFAAQNCPDFFYRLSEQEITHSGYELGNYIPIKNENCKNSFVLWDQNPMYMSNSTIYINGDSILHFQNGLHDQTFKYLFSKNCTSFFEVIKEVNDSHILLNVGDTFSRERIAYFEDLFLVEFRFKKFVSLELEKASTSR